MFFHNFKYIVKSLFRNRMMVFWTFAFPIILGTFFYMAFSDIENSEKLQTFSVAVVKDESVADDSILLNALDQMDVKENEDGVFELEYTTLERAEQLLLDREIVGYLRFDQAKPKVVVEGNGIEQTVFKYVIDQVLEAKKMVGDVLEAELEKNPGIAQDQIDQIVQEALALYQNSSGTLVDQSSSNMSYMVIEFYTLIAMCCLYGSLFGMIVVNQSLPNMSTKGARVSIAPSRRSSLLGSGLLAGYVVQLTGVLLLLAFLKLVLKINFGTSFSYVLLLSFAGSLAGLVLGLLVGSCFRTNETNKTGIIITATMLFCFLSGMMGVTMKYIVDKNVPFLNWINPANMITDGFYSLYYYQPLDRFYFNLISLLLFSLVLFLISIFKLRRQRYDSI